MKTASDSRQGDGDSDSSIRSVSGADGKDESRSESISEDFNFDETMTEDEMEEKSFKAILPSESHRKRAKKQLDNVSVTSDEGSVSGSGWYNGLIESSSVCLTVLHNKFRCACGEIIHV